MRQAVLLAVNSGMEFYVSDFEQLISSFRGEYWIGSSPESFYAAAVHVRNLSACRAYEHWQRRKPFTIEGKRVFVGREFRWQGCRVRCTSISTDFFIAVAPKGWEDGAAERFNYKPDKIFRITRDQLREAKKTALANAA